MKNNIPPDKTHNLAYLKICEECGKTFYSKKCSTSFCSPKCNQINYYKRRKQKRTGPLQKQHHVGISDNQNNFRRDKRKDVDLLTVKEFAERLGVCKQTVYNMAEAGHLRIIHFTSRLSYISWSEFNDCLKNKHIPIRQPKSDTPPSNPPIYSDATVMKWQQNNTELLAMTSKPPVKPKNKTKHNAKQESLSSDSNSEPVEKKADGLWLDADEGSRRYKMTVSAFHSFVSLRKISKKSGDNGKMLYSQGELDKLRGVKLPSKKYITVFDACSIYSLSFATIYKIIRDNNIEKCKYDGKKMFPQEEFEKALKRPRNA